MPMKIKRSICALLFLFFCTAVRGAPGSVPQDSNVSVVARGIVYADAATLAAELRRIGTAIEQERPDPAGLAAVRKNLPSHWELNASEFHYQISAEPLSGLLREAEAGKKPKAIVAKAEEAAEWAFDLATQVKSFAGGQTGEDANDKAALHRILSRREFGAVKGPSAWDLFRQRVIREILSLLGSVFEQIGRYPMGARILFWLVILAVVVWLAVTLFRSWARRSAMEELRAPDAGAYIRSWQEWIQAAREAATRGDFREAVHSAYWAGISYLEDSEVVRKDRTRTPREYMRLVSNATQLAASGRKTREALSSLTIVLEQVWYGRRPASNEDFANAIQSVEALGCQLQ
jgi:Domain of unknown function (DUF4129)